MTTYRRVFQPGGTYFFTVVTDGRRPVLVDHIDHLRRAFSVARRRRPFEIDAIVVLPEHLHTLWRLPDGDANFSTRWMTIKRLFSATFEPRAVAPSTCRKREKGVWQRRFWEHLIRDENDWRRHMDYIHYNPVKHGHCGAPIDWPYSSFRRCVAAGLYEPDWGREHPSGLEGKELEWGE